MAKYSDKFRHMNLRPGYRTAVQLVFLLITVFIGMEFYAFVAQLKAGGPVTVARPPGVEAFLPISALVSLKYFLFTGVFNRVHPSALVLFLIICSTALMFKKSFCSWICPFGFLSDLLARCHKALFKKRLGLPLWADRMLRLLKYLIAGFFIWSIFVKMPVPSLEQFIYSPYHRFSDVKMLEFFTHISLTASAVLAALVILSVILPYFWCRYLCPYGGLLGILGLLSPGRIRRDRQSCTRCGRCESVCPGRIQITRTPRVNSMECTACLRCVDACPSPGTIGFSIAGSPAVPSKGMALALIVVFFTGIAAARQSGHWQNDTPVQAYRSYLAPRPSPWTALEGMDPEKMKRMMEMVKRMQMQQDG